MANGVREPRSAPNGSPAVVHSEALAQARLYLDRLRIRHLDLSRRFLEAADHQVYEIDLVVAAAMSRSYSLVDGFISAFDSWSPVVMAPLLRMQIDSLVRLAYMASAPSADEVAHYLVGGGEFRGLKDDSGKKLTDRRLLEHANERHPWLLDVYEATSGWVHFSPSILWSAWQVSKDPAAGDEGALQLFGAVPIRPDQVPVTALQELLGAMTRSTSELFGYVEAWEARKGLPAGKMRPLAGRDGGEPR